MGAGRAGRGQRPVVPDPRCRIAGHKDPQTPSRARPRIRAAGPERHGRPGRTRAANTGGCARDAATSGRAGPATDPGSETGRRGGLTTAEAGGTAGPEPVPVPTETAPATSASDNIATGRDSRCPSLRRWLSNPTTSRSTRHPASGKRQGSDPAARFRTSASPINARWTSAGRRRQSTSNPPPGKRIAGRHAARQLRLPCRRGGGYRQPPRSGIHRLRDDRRPCGSQEEMERCRIRRALGVAGV